jgi:hypothetical protein
MPEGVSVLDHVLAIIAANDRRYEQRFDASQKALELGLVAQKSAVDAALAAQNAAVIKAESATERRFDGVNEFRATLADQQRTLIPRAEVEVIQKALDSRVEKLETALLMIGAQRTGRLDGWGYAVGAVGLFGGIAALIISFMKG